MSFEHLNPDIMVEGKFDEDLHEDILMETVDQMIDEDEEVDKEILQGRGDGELVDIIDDDDEDEDDDDNEEDDDDDEGYDDDEDDDDEDYDDDEDDDEDEKCEKCGKNPCVCDDEDDYDEEDNDDDDDDEEEYKD